MAEDKDKKKNDAVKVDKKEVGGIHLKTYTLQDQNSSIFTIQSEADIERKIQEYEEKMQWQSEKSFQERQAKTAAQMKAELFAEMEENYFDVNEIKAEGAADSIKLDPEKISEKMKEIVKDDRIVCIGDSITYGYEVEGSLTWIGRLRREEEINLLNLGLNGDTSEGMYHRFREHVIDLKPKACLIMGGGNDIIGGTPLEYVTNNIAMMAQMALDNGIVPMIGIVPEPNHKKIPEAYRAFIDYDKVKEDLAVFKEWLIMFAKANNMPYIDFDTGLKTRLRQGYSRYFIDGAHPNPAGHKMMALVAKEAFIEMGILKEKTIDDRFSL